MLTVILKHIDRERIDDEDTRELYTPLIWASKEGNHKIVEKLCKFGAKPDKRAGWNKTTALIKG